LLSGLDKFTGFCLEPDLLVGVIFYVSTELM